MKGNNMNNLKKIGLTALGTALVTAGSAQAASLSVSGATSIFFNGEDNSDMGNGWSMTDSISFEASGEMDNGFTVSTAFELDNGALDDRSITIDTGDMGKLTFSGSGTSGPIGAWDDVTPSANEEAHGVATAGTASGAANAASSANRFVYDYTAMDGLAIKAAYTPSAGVGVVESSTELGALYTGIEGLSLYVATGENNNQPATGITGKADLTAFAAVYTMGAISVGYQVNETDSGTANQDEDFTAIGVSYAVSDDLSISYNVSEIDFESSTEDQDATGVSFSYTSGGMTISGTHSSIDNVAGTGTADNTGYEVNFAFAF
jgi:outer membrane protein OmpU